MHVNSVHWTGLYKCEPHNVKMRLVLLFPSNYPISHPISHLIIPFARPDNQGHPLFLTPELLMTPHK